VSEYTVTRKDMADAIYREIGLSRRESMALVGSIIDHVISCLLRGETVKISGFGTFDVYESKPRLGRNPKTGREVEIMARKTIRFKPSLALRERVDSALSQK